MHDLVITRAHFQCGPMIAPCEITFTTESGGELVWKGMVTPQCDPVAISVPGEGQLYIEHDRMTTASIAHKEHLMRTTRHTFEEVKLTVKATAPCGKCGKKCTRTKVFSQTLNPFNTNPDGSVKTRDQIMDELRPKAAHYRGGPIYHVKCEG
jgi:hypothetical protein